MTMSHATNEFSRPLALALLAQEGEARRVMEADAAERAALADRFSLLRLDRLWASVHARAKGPGGLIVVEGRFEARVVQACVVTLEPVTAELADSFTLTFKRSRGPGDAARKEVFVEVEAAEPPEIIETDDLDLGEVVAQLVAVALDPYPRAPGAHLEADGDRDDEAARVTPFGALADLKRRP